MHVDQLLTGKFPLGTHHNMSQLQFRFYAELNDFLPQSLRQIRFPYDFSGNVTVKHLVESLNVPHTEIDLILANGRSVGFSYSVKDGDLISVYPVFESIDISSVGRLRPIPLRETKFILDTHLGQLASYLRLIGFDTLYRNDYQDPELAQIASSQRRILLTKDRGLLKRNLVTHGYCVRNKVPRDQLVEVVRRFDLSDSMQPFKRCLRCNHLLQPIEKEKISHRLLANTRRYYNEFTMCTGCQQLYWPGSHYLRMCRFLKEALKLEL
jgi:uncharacterized protein with PIN domain